MRNRQKELVPCENAFRGCNIKFRASDTSTHARNCLFQYVICHLCDKRVLLRDLVFHQKVQQCYEKRIKREKIVHSKFIHLQVMAHFRQIHVQSASRHVAHWRHFKDKLHSRIGWTPPVPPAWNPEMLSERMRVGQMYLDRQKSTNLQLDLGEEDPPQLLSVRTDRGSLHQQVGNDEEFVFIPDSMKRAQTARSASEQGAVCMRCSKVYRASANHKTACRWHKGPLIRTYRVCSSCGQLSHRPGCCTGTHLPIEI